MSPAVEILWYLNSRCNFDCPYCSYSFGLREELVRTEKVYPYELWLKAWQRFGQRYGPAVIYISGSGEPTLYRGFISMLRELSRTHHVIFDTNLSWPMATLQRFMAEVQPSRLRVETSFHPSEMEAGTFVAKAACLKERGFVVNCRFVAYPPSLGRLEEYRKVFKSKDLPFVLTPFNGRWNGIEYPEGYSIEEKAAIAGAAQREARDSIRSKQVELVDHLLNEHAVSPKGRLCRSGQKYACLMPNGLIYRCQEYGVRRWEPMGSFIDQSFDLTDSPKECRSSSCGCAYRWLVDEAERFRNAGALIA